MSDSSTPKVLTPPMGRIALRLVRERSAEGQTEPARAPSEPPIEDAQLLAAIRAGDESAASELHDRLRPRVDATIRALLGRGHPDLDDLAQQSFIEIVLSMHRYRGECSLATWAATIAARTVFKFLRRKTTERRIFRMPEPDAEEAAAPASLGRALAARSAAARIRTHIAAMDAAKAEAFILHDVCGFDAREIAGIVGISEAATHARIARGRRELHARLAADPELQDVLLDLEVES